MTRRGWSRRRDVRSLRLPGEPPGRGQVVFYARVVLREDEVPGSWRGGPRAGRAALAGRRRASFRGLRLP